MNAQQQESLLALAVDTIRLLVAAGARLREQTAAACDRSPTWAVLVCDPARVDLMGAPLDVVLAVLDLEPTQPLILHRPADVLSQVLGLEGAGEAGELGAQLAAIPPDGWCRCLVATQRDTRVIQLPRSGALPAVVVDGHGAGELAICNQEAD
jgi:hypothetical protein